MSRAHDVTIRVQLGGDVPQGVHVLHDGRKRDVSLRFQPLARVPRPVNQFGFSEGGREKERLAYGLGATMCLKRWLCPCKPLTHCVLPRTYRIHRFSRLQ